MPMKHTSKKQQTKFKICKHIFSNKQSVVTFFSLWITTVWEKKNLYSSIKLENVSVGRLITTNGYNFTSREFAWKMRYHLFNSCLNWETKLTLNKNFTGFWQMSPKLRSDIFNYYEPSIVWELPNHFNSLILVFIRGTTSCNFYLSWLSSLITRIHFLLVQTHWERCLSHRFLWHWAHSREVRYK